MPPWLASFGPLLWSLVQNGSSVAKDFTGGGVGICPVSGIAETSVVVQALEERGGTMPLREWSWLVVAKLN